MAETCLNFLLLMFGVKVLLKHCLLKVLRSVNHSTWCNYCRTMSRLIIPCIISTCEKVGGNYSKCNTNFQAVLSPSSSKRSILVIYCVHVKLSFPFVTSFSITLSCMTLSSNILLDISTLHSYESYPILHNLKRFYQTNKKRAKCGQC